MEQYQSPTSELEGTNKEFKPKSGVVYSLLFAIIGVFLTSTVLAMAFAIVANADYSDPDGFYSELTKNVFFLVLDLLSDFLVLVVAGRMLAKRVPGKENVYSLGVTISIFAFFVLMAVGNEDMSLFPIWYNVLSYIIFAIGIHVGVMSKK